MIVDRCICLRRPGTACWRFSGRRRPDALDLIRWPLPNTGRWRRQTVDLIVWNQPQCWPRWRNCAHGRSERGCEIRVKSGKNFIDGRFSFAFLALRNTFRNVACEARSYRSSMPEMLIIKPSALRDIVHGLQVAASIKAQRP